MNKRQDTSGLIEIRALNPDGDLACDTTIATPEARARIDGLRSFLLPRVRDLPDGVEVTFQPEGWDVVRRYVELESQCCGFLTLRAEQRTHDVVVTVTGRPEAKPWIGQIFAAGNDHA